MSKRKTLLAAGVVRDILFADDDVRELYFYNLNRMGVEYKILDSFQRADGSVIERILQQYNNCPLVQLFSE